MSENRVNFITGNEGKVHSMRRYTDGYGIDIVQTPLDLTEPQCNTIQEVSASKARQAFRILSPQPVMVEDSGFFVDALNGFPGPYTKYAVETIGIRGMLDLMRDIEDRRCRFVSVLTYQDGNGPHSFTDDKMRYTMAETPDESPRQSKNWSELWRIIIPEGADKPLSAFTEADWKQRAEARKEFSAFSQFARWYTTDRK